MRPDQHTRPRGRPVPRRRSARSAIRESTSLQTPIRGRSDFRVGHGSAFSEPGPDRRGDARALVPKRQPAGARPALLHFDQSDTGVESRVALTLSLWLPSSSRSFSRLALTRLLWLRRSGRSASCSTHCWPPNRKRRLGSLSSLKCAGSAQSCLASASASTNSRSASPSVCCAFQRDWSLVLIAVQASSSRSPGYVWEPGSV